MNVRGAEKLETKYSLSEKKKNSLSWSGNSVNPRRMIHSEANGVQFASLHQDKIQD